MARARLEELNDRVVIDGVVYVKTKELKHRRCAGCVFYTNNTHTCGWMTGTKNKAAELCLEEANSTEDNPFIWELL